MDQEDPGWSTGGSRGSGFAYRWIKRIKEGLKVDQEDPGGSKGGSRGSRRVYRWITRIEVDFVPIPS